MFWWNSDFYVMISFIIQLKQWMFWGQGDRLEVFVGVLWSYIIARWFSNSLGETKWDGKYLMMYRVFYFSLLPLVQVLVCKYYPPGNEHIPQKWHFEDDLPFLKVGYVNSLEGYYYFYYYHHHHHHYHHFPSTWKFTKEWRRVLFGGWSLESLILMIFNWWLTLVVWRPVVWDFRVSLSKNPFHKGMPLNPKPPGTKPPNYT